MTPEVPPPSAALLERLAGLRPVRLRRPLREAAIVTLASLTAVAAFLAWSGARLDAQSLPVIFASLACALGFGAQLWWALVPPRGQVLPLRRAAVARVVVAWILMLGALVVAARHGSLETGPMFMKYARACLQLGCAMAMVPALLGLVLLRRALELGGWRLGLAVGGAAGALGGLALELHCPNTHLVHVLLAHGGAIALPALLFALVVRRW